MNIIIREPVASPQANRVRTLAIRDILARKHWQVRTKLDQATVSRYVTIFRSGGQMPPITVANVGGTLLLVDGWHRLQALKGIGAATVEAEVFEATEDEAQWAAARANLMHGLPLKKSELLNVFRAYISSNLHRKRRGYKSYREIAEDLENSVAHTTIRNWMRVHYPAIYRAMGDGPDPANCKNNNGPHWGYGQTPLEHAKESLDTALNEARSMRPEDRSRLLVHARAVLAKMEQTGPWSALEQEQENTDF
ncbi:ParB/RepB/Spo0J family partition protein [Bradyrhizobium sp. MOS002]|uniref:ParB/RepB/Spo0J family partition protein n=1 Tax=Bradyrhizobium sp. MOS002 TaxID=2133947 RepID=UPI001304AAB0|nr:ParB/RepB/Spo0J family partition protein [Bradyrhizobium sp. MOS002]